MPKEIQAKTILNKSKRRDPWFLDDYTVNPFLACSFNCLFCYIRGSKYGEHMDSAMAIKTNAVELLDKQLGNRAKKGQFGIIVLSSASDPYVKVEKEIGLTRRLLEVIAKYRFPVHMITRSDLISRDIDLLHEINENAILPNDLKDKLPGGTIVSFSFSTLDDGIARIFEPGATPPSKRLLTVEKMKKEGFRTGISLMPLLPFISDTTESLEDLFSTFKKLELDYVLPATLGLYGNGKADSRTLVLGAIKKHFPELLEKYEKWFNQSDEMPRFYRDAFYIKMAELEKDFGIPNRILPQQ